MKRIYIFSLFAVLFTLSGVAQTIPFQSEWAGKESVTLQFSLSVPDSVAGSDYAVCITPYVSNRRDTLFLDPVIFRGKRNQKYTERARFYGDAPAPQGDELTLQDRKNYTVTLATREHPWLAEGRIEVEALVEKEGCCEVSDLQGQHYGHFAYIPPFVPKFAPVEDNTGKAGELQKDNPVLEHISQYRPYDSTRILRKEKGMLYVNFPLDKTTLSRDFRNNAATLDRIVEITRDIMADTTSSVKLIQIIGLASAEGSIRHNEWLAGGRATALKKYVQHQLYVPDSLFELCNGGEGWSELRDQINDTEFEGQKELLEVIDNTADANERERKMKRLQGGKPYRYVKEHILQDQRNSGYMRIYYDYVPDTKAKIINRASELIRQEKYAEALPMLQGVSDDPRSWNALGVALYMTGQEAEAIDILRRAAATGNADAQRNVKQFDAVMKARKAAQ